VKEKTVGINLGDNTIKKLFSKKEVKMIRLNSALAGGLLPALLVLGIFVCFACAGEDTGTDSTVLTRVEPMPLEDEEITDAVGLELLLDEGVSSHLIDVKTEEGIVTLSGTVDNVLAKERATRIAEMIRGVRSVVNTIEVDPVERKDSDIRKDIERALLLDPAADSYEVGVEVDDGTVTLTGTVDSWAEKRLSAHVAKGVKGVKEVQNDISIEYETDRTDAEIKNEVERQLEVNPMIDDGLIEVKVEDRKVMLSGTVGSAMEKTRAFNTSWVAGVIEVEDSGLDVEFWAEDEHKRKMMVIKSDEEVEEAVEDAFFYDPRVFSFKIDVDADNGLVTLSGQVDNLQAKNAAAQDARNTIGVWNVENDIKVRPVNPPTDEDIERYVEDALLWNPVVERFDLTVVVRNKKVHLYGRVDNAYEKSKAEDVASRINGVAAVDNNIEVEGVWTWKSDRQIKEEIEQQLSWSIYVTEEKIDVFVENGIATLEGEVNSIVELDSAIKDAFDGGARRVINRLAIKEYPDYYPDIYFRDYRWPYWPTWPNWPPILK
jgi:osmotically-inducible protein OsmY